jgi:hypothetical protein
MGRAATAPSHVPSAARALAATAAPGSAVKRRWTCVGWAGSVERCQLSGVGWVGSVERC